jgi:hypothetical protein
MDDAVGLLDADISLFRSLDWLLVPQEWSILCVLAIPGEPQEKIIHARK